MLTHPKVTLSQWGIPWGKRGMIRHRGTTHRGTTYVRGYRKLSAFSSTRTVCDSIAGYMQRIEADPNGFLWTLRMSA